MFAVPVAYHVKLRVPAVERQQPNITAIYHRRVFCGVQSHGAAVAVLHPKRLAAHNMHKRRRTSHDRLASASSWGHTVSPSNRNLAIDAILEDNRASTRPDEDAAPLDVYGTNVIWAVKQQHLARVQVLQGHDPPATTSHHTCMFQTIT